MAQLFVCDANGWITADVEARGPVLAAALEHEQAESVVRCAVLMALSALAKGDAWPDMVLRNMSAFMTNMKDEVRGEQLM